ncbi:unnamed protein product [Anisakis simplex]|uniref:Fibronectin type-III domain-containing protein n=1 Tax=Anisakis simplex TaxID=6269 RepID=A0A3P6RW82_ANISI|nr:unnamed protein product [Anisakis simplex]
MFIVVYILFGIPLYLITIADMAKFCTEGMNRTYTEVLKYKFQIQRKYRRWKSGRKRRESVAIGEIIIAGGDDEVAEFLWAHLENTHFVEVPFVLIYSVLLLYVLIATYLMSRIEGWSCYDGFYFVMTSVLTIGFGDLIPTNQRFILITLFIILVGLVLMTTSIDVVGAYYIDRLHFFGRRFETQDPLAWLKAVQQKRIRAMKREAMRKLFETVTALQHLHFGKPPRPPHSLTASNATAESVLLKWEPPVLVDERRKYWYTLTYKTSVHLKLNLYPKGCFRTPQLRYNPMTVIDFITTPYYEVRSLQSFTLYEFSVVTTTRYGCSKSIKCQEYTEPCTVPQSLRLVAISAETATFSWKAPRKNNGAESYVILFAQEPAPQFHYWKRYRCGKSKKFTITDLSPDTRYIHLDELQKNDFHYAITNFVFH